MNAIERDVESFETGRISAAEFRALLARTLSDAPEARVKTLQYLQSLQSRGRLREVSLSGLIDPMDEDAQTLLSSSRDRPQNIPPEEAATQACAADPHGEEITLMGRIAAVRSAVAPSVERNGVLERGTCLRERYVLDTPIGQGAMGQVWKAQDLFSVEAHDKNPWVAIKLLLSDVDRFPQAFAAMHREASRTQRLAHPNIVTVYTLDRDERSGRAFIAMELLEGEPLDQFIKRQREAPVSFKQLWPIVIAMAQGLAYAHRKGIVHSDFKPGNVFLTREGVPKILDFGIARAAKVGEGVIGADDDDSVLSGYTPTYASPEMLAEQHPHPSDDVFALGLVTYELLTGEHPFGRRPADRASAAGAAPQPIKGISRRSWRALERALQFERGARWSDAGQFADALQKRTGLHKALAASMVALLLTAGGLSYKNYQDNLPAVPFEQLPAAQRLQVQKAIADGQESLRYVREHQLIEAAADAADRFADAYAMHVRNPDAVLGLQAAAGYFIDWWERQPDRQQALTELKKFQEKSEYYRGYRPLKRAIAALETQ